MIKWIPLSARHRMALFSPLKRNFQHWQRKFFKIVDTPDLANLFYDSKKHPLFPFYSTKNPCRSIVVDFKAPDLAEKKVSCYLVHLPTLTCIELIQAAKEGRVNQFFSKLLYCHEMTKLLLLLDLLLILFLLLGEMGKVKVDISAGNMVAFLAEQTELAKIKKRKETKVSRAATTDDDREVKCHKSSTTSEKPFKQSTIRLTRSSTTPKKSITSKETKKNDGKKNDASSLPPPEFQVGVAGGLTRVDTPCPPHIPHSTLRSASCSFFELQDSAFNGLDFMT